MDFPTLSIGKSKGGNTREGPRSKLFHFHAVFMKKMAEITGFHPTFVVGAPKKSWIYNCWPVPVFLRVWHRRPLIVRVRAHQRRSAAHRSVARLGEPASLLVPPSTFAEKYQTKNWLNFWVKYCRQQSICAATGDPQYPLVRAPGLRPTSFTICCTPQGRTEWGKCLHLHVMV